MSQDLKHNQLSTDFLVSLIRGICHDVGAPARHVVQFSQLLTEQSSGFSDQKHEKWLHYVVDGGRKIQDLLSCLSRMTNLISNNNAEECSTQLVFEEVLVEVRALATREERNLNISQCGAWPMVLMNKTHLRTLFYELANNAYTFQSKASDHRIMLEVRCDVSDNKLHFSIEDNGIGLSDTQIPDICRAFKRFNSAGEYKGNGIGLTYCQLIAELNEATLVFGHSEKLGGLKVDYVQSLNAENKIVEC